jgi:hypothetical protein
MMPSCFLLSVPRSFVGYSFPDGDSMWLERKPRLSWAPEVMTDSGSWAGNGLRFASKEEAEMYVAQFSSTRSTRVIESFDPVNYRWDNGQVIRVKA